ncbi:tyrosine-type recombinase/integrase [Dysosmobacter welbionis]|uniref:tyrosine-type recombinase/integrase n=1 Tax=Dysosmobacter welbionis TaxID=2093857 RepID=UPI00300F2107
MREAMETALQDRTAAPAELTVTWEEVCRYLDSLAARGRRRETIQVYRPKLEAFYHFLPEDKRVAADTLELWRAALLREGYSPGTANTHVSAANGLLAYLGRRDLQLIGQLDTEEEIQPELSRTEYLRLLATARNLGRERTYLMVKVFALTGIRVSELNRVTVRAVEEGRVLTACDGRAQYVLIPACLRKELAVYLRRVGITAGPVFVTRSGRPMRRTQVSGEIRTLCRDARVDGDKSNPRCLRRLYQVTQERIRDSVQILAEQAHERMLEEEQLTVGWEQGS